MTKGAGIFARPYPQAIVEAGEATGDALISITGFGRPLARIDEAAFGNRVLRLAFDDIPNLEWIDPQGYSWRGPTADQLNSALDFARSIAAEKDGQDCQIAVHCTQGKSRSAAVALAIMADSLGPGEEREAVRRLLAHDPEGRICCNPGLVRMADKLLRREGAIEEALAEACPSFVTWRAYWAEKGCLTSA